VPLVVIFGWLMLAFAALGFRALCVNLGDGRAGRLGLIVYAFALLAAAAVATALALLLSGITCDESCEPETSDHWYDDPDAWQWDAQALLALVGILIATAGVVQTLRRRYRSASMLIAGSAVTFAGWLALIAAGA
jgi:hypothetical protein